MVRIVFIGNGFHNRLKVLNTIESCIINVVNGVSEASILDKLPNDVIDLFIVDRTKPLFRSIITSINSNISINHIPIISLITKKDLQSETINDGDLFVSEFVTDIEFKYYVKAMLKMKLMDDELKKEKIILELKVKERTSELENKAERLNITLNSIGDGVIVTDAEGYINSMNPVASNLCKMDIDDYKGRLVDELFEIYIDDKRINIFDIVSSTKKTYNLPLDSLLISSTNEKIRISDSASPMFSKNGNFTGMVLVFHDITEEYALRTEILAGEKKYRRIYDNVPDMIFTHDLNCNFMTVNENVKQLGYEVNELVGEHLSILLDEENLQIALNELKSKIKNPGVVHEFTIEVTTKDNIRKNLNIKSHLIENSNEIFGIARDVTERMEYQKQLEEAKDIAEQSDKIKGVFISNISHEIRTPMNSILGFASLLENEKNQKKIKNYIDIISSQGNLLLNLIDNIMDLSKIESGNMKMKKKIFNTKNIYKVLKEQFKLELKNREKYDIILISGINKHHDIYTDYERINQVLNNLFLNAIKFTKSGYIKYGYTIKEKFIEFYVEDTGIGIKKENFDLVFERFYQIDRERNKKQEGIGIGLTMCKAIVNLMGGKLWVESEYGIGSTFYFTVPIEEPIEEPIIKLKETKITPINDDICKGKKILVVEDNDTNYELLEILLLSSNITVERANDHNIFFEKIKDFNYDMVLLDINLPELDGWEILKWLKENKKEMFVIIQTAYSSHENELKAESLGADAFITKPINPSELLHEIKKICIQKDE